MTAGESLQVNQSLFPSAASVGSRLDSGSRPLPLVKQHRPPTLSTFHAEYFRYFWMKYKYELHPAVQAGEVHIAQHRSQLQVTSLGVFTERSDRGDELVTQ